MLTGESQHNGRTWTWTFAFGRVREGLMGCKAIFKGISKSPNGHRSPWLFPKHLLAGSCTRSQGYSEQRATIPAHMSSQTLNRKKADKSRPVPHWGASMYQTPRQGVTCRLSSIARHFSAVCSTLISTWPIRKLRLRRVKGTGPNPTPGKQGAQAIWLQTNCEIGPCLAFLSTKKT